MLTVELFIYYLWPDPSISFVYTIVSIPVQYSHKHDIGPVFCLTCTISLFISEIPNLKKFFSLNSFISSREINSSSLRSYSIVLNILIICQIFIPLYTKSLQRHYVFIPKTLIPNRLYPESIQSRASIS